MINEWRNQLHSGNFDDIAPHLPQGAFSLIITDPPYSKEIAPYCFDLLAKHAPRLLCDGGSLVVIAPHYLLPLATHILGHTLKYRWIYCMDQENGPHPRMAMGIEVCWKPLLHYVKRAYPQGRGFIRDKFIVPEPQKDLHTWQQAEAMSDYFIEKLSDPGSVILDPFVGTGTTIISALKQNRKYVGVDIDPEMINKARKRIDEYANVQ